MDDDDREGEYLLVVKNTFLDLNDHARIPKLTRVMTEPGPEPKELFVDARGGDESDGDEFKDCEDVDQGDAGAQPEPDQLPELNRIVTYDEYEPGASWAWTGAGGSLPAPPAAAPQLPATAGPNVPVVPNLPPASPPLFLMPAGPARVPQANIQEIRGCGTFGRLPATLAPPALPQRAPHLPRTAPPLEAPVIPVGIGAPEPPPPPVAHRAPVLERVRSERRPQVHRIRWTVDARKLESSDGGAVSPAFSVGFDQEAEFKMVVRSQAVSDARHGSCFKRANGRGTVQLKCLEVVASTMNVVFRIGVGSQGRPSEPFRPRGEPVHHDFAQKIITGLPEGEDVWDFLNHVDEITKTFVVCLEILSVSSE